MHINSCYLCTQLVHQTFYPLVQYLIIHNVSSDQSPITVNRTNVTLYGVQPGETYTVEINPYFLTEKGESTNFFFSYAVFFSEAATTMCTITTTPTTNTPIQSDTSKYSETGWLASVSHNYDLSFTIPFSPYSVFSSVNSIMDSGDDSSTLGAADGGCGYYCYILCLQER